MAGLRRWEKTERDARLFLPSTFLVAVRFKALPAFVLRHLETSFLLQISHGKSRCLAGQLASPLRRCKARIYTTRKGIGTARLHCVKINSPSTDPKFRPVNTATTRQYSSSWPAWRAAAPTNNSSANRSVLKS